MARSQTAAPVSEATKAELAASKTRRVASGAEKPTEAPVKASKPKTTAAPKTTEAPAPAEKAPVKEARAYNRYTPLEDPQKELDRATEALTAARKRLSNAERDNAGEDLIHRYTVRLARFEKHVADAQARLAPAAPARKTRTAKSAAA